MSEQIKLKEAETFHMGNVAVEIPAGTVITLPGVDGVDALAAALAHVTAIYGKYRDILAHETTGNRIVDGVEKLVKIGVSYGIGGVRIEQIIGDVEEVAAEAASLAANAEPQPPAGEAGEGGEASEQPTEASAPSEAEASQSAAVEPQVEGVTEPPVPEGQPELAPQSAEEQAAMGEAEKSAAEATQTTDTTAS